VGACGVAGLPSGVGVAMGGAAGVCGVAGATDAVEGVGLAGSEFCTGAAGAGAAWAAAIENADSAALLAGLLTNRVAVPGCADSLTLSCNSSRVALIR